MYEVRSWTKDAELDDWNDGCQPDTRVCFSGNEHFSAKDLDGLIKVLQDFFWAEACTVGVCDQPNRIDFVRMENGDGERPSEAELAEWREGKIKLWYAVYTVFVYEVERKEAHLEYEEYDFTDYPA